MNAIPLCICVTFCLPIRLLMDIWVASPTTDERKDKTTVLSDAAGGILTEPLGQV